MFEIPFLKTKTDLIFIEIKIKEMDQSFAAIIDTGIEISTVDTKINYVDRSSSLMAIASISPGSKVLMKDARITFEILSKHGVTLKFTEAFMRCDIIDSYECDDTNLLPVAMIIGGDILKKWKANIDYEKMTLTI